MIYSELKELADKVAEIVKRRAQYELDADNTELYEWCVREAERFTGLTNRERRLYIKALYHAGEWGKNI